MIRLAQQHQDWVLGYLDEVWWSRFAQPKMHSWCFDQDDHPLRLLEKQPKAEDQEPKALACYGVLLEACPALHGQMLLRFVKGRPVSQVTCEFLDWVCQRLEQAGKRVWALIWDNASWHKSQQVRSWIKKHNSTVKRCGGVRIVPCLLPTKSPWLNPIEPKWLHGRRAIVEPEAVLTVQVVMERVCAHFGCDLMGFLEQKVL